MLFLIFIFSHKTLLYFKINYNMYFFVWYLLLYLLLYIQGCACTSEKIGDYRRCGV